MAQSFSTIATVGNTPVPGRERSPLEDAVDLDNLNRVQSLIKHDASSGDPQAWKHLLRRALPLVKSKEVGEELIANGADIKAKGEGGSTVLMETNDLSAIQWLIVDQKVELEEKDDRGRTALWRTVQNHDDPSKAIFLIDHNGVNINASDREGRTVLMTAVWKGRIEVVDKLLSRKSPDTEVEIDKLDGRGRTALHHLASDRDRTYEYHDSAEPNSRQDIDQRILEKLLNAGHKLGAKDDKGLTCLHLAAATGKILLGTKSVFTVCASVACSPTACLALCLNVGDKSSRTILNGFGDLLIIPIDF